MDSDRKQILKMVEIKKSFSGVPALTEITFDLYHGEIHCLVGENGAGKSTLMKILSGAYAPTTGKIIVENSEYSSLTPSLAKALGINIVYQENDLVPSMTVAENIHIGNENARYGFWMDHQKMIMQTQSSIDRLGLHIDPKSKIQDLSVSDQQFVKILKALSDSPKILIMDEPTSMFNVYDSRKVLSLTKRISAEGISVIYISHYLKEVVEIADRITVIRDGEVIRSFKIIIRNI